MVDFGSIKGFFTGSTTATPAPAPPAPAPPPAAPKPAGATDSFSTGSTPGSAFRNFTNPMDVIENVAKKTGEAIKPHVPGPVAKTMEDLGKMREANKNNPDQPLDKLIGPTVDAADKWAKDTFPWLKEKLTPVPQPPPPPPVDLGDLD